MEKKSFGFGPFRLEPEVFGYELNKSELIRLGLAACLILFMKYIPIPNLPATGATMLGIVLGCMLIWSINKIPQAFGVFVCLISMIMHHMLNWGTVAGKLGTTPLLMLTCLMIFSTGMQNTKMAERLSYGLMLKLGTSPFALVAALFITEVVLSAFIANMPALLVVAAIAVGILKELGEVPGKSKFGAAVMISITTASLVGGLCMISSSGQNPTVISILEATTDGKYTITFNQWASAGIPFAIIMTPIILIVLKVMFRLNPKDCPITLSRESIVEKNKALGPMTDPEKRFLIDLVVLTALYVTTKYTGFNPPIVAVIGALIVTCPFLGAVDLRNALKNLPWNIVLMTISGTFMALCITESGLSEWLVDNLLGWTKGFSPFWIIMISSLITTYLHFIYVGNSSTIVMPAGVTLALAVGFNPMYIIIPMAFAGSCTVMMPFATDTLITYGYGYWSYKEMAKSGTIIGLFWAIGVTLVCYFVLPIAGVPLYI